ncbi:MAG: hypothetical protein B7Z60_06940 [Ferrovum sp. 37-45-19]|jgi:hypothetical protein|nr:MAG: hypothetical protein B7Z65_08905 [Ferrovum sp. 21-44-67]OYV93931.1 MAG: hypothetical protein B7Z60_06940 [Ferrovum sp. 37-45-19]OZB32001.1 MAG: hypothetical protein B7X47_07720 [Ferrovum sp. 34-44-207]
MMAGCAQQGVWVKDAVPKQSEIDHYQCLKESQQVQGWSNPGFYAPYAYGYSSVGNSVITTETNDELYQACMTAKGYTFHKK